MLSFLPPLFPHDPHTLWYPSLSSNPQQPPPPPSQHTPPHQSHPNNNNNHHPHQQQHQQTQPRPLRTPLTTLHTDETALLARKANIRRFGAGWLRPPGVLKTLQGMADERAEREEVEAARAREMEAAADAEIGGVGFVAEEEGGGMSDGEGERDLDDEIPEEEEEGGSYEHTDTDSSTEGGDEGSSDEEGDGDRGGPRMATFNTRTGEVVRTLGSGGGGSGSEVVVAPSFGGRRGVFGGMSPGMGEN